MAYKTIAPGKQVRSPAARTPSFKIRNQSDPAARGKYKIKVGNQTPKTVAILHNGREDYGCANNAVVLDNVGECDLEWQRN
jgi:hypothetical protein